MKESHSVLPYKCQTKYIQFEPYNLDECYVKFYVKYKNKKSIF